MGNFIKDEDGISAVEYGLSVALVAVALTAVSLTGTNLSCKVQPGRHLGVA